MIKTDDEEDDDPGSPMTSDLHPHHLCPVCIICVFRATVSQETRSVSNLHHLHLPGLPSGFPLSSPSRLNSATL